MRVIRKPPVQKNFATVEDQFNAIHKLRLLAGNAVAQAGVENRKLGLPVVVIRGNQVISVDARKGEKVIAVLPKNSRRYKPGQVFHVRKG